MEYCQKDGNNMMQLPSHIQDYQLPYSAAEVINKEERNESSDVYSYGCLAWEMFGSKIPWSWLTNLEIKALAKINSSIRLPMQECWPTYLQNIITKCTTRDSSKRSDSFHSILDLFRVETQPRLCQCKSILKNSSSKMFNGFKPSRTSNSKVKFSMKDMQHCESTSTQANSEYGENKNTNQFVMKRKIFNNASVLSGANSSFSSACPVHSRDTILSESCSHCSLNKTMMTHHNNKNSTDQFSFHTTTSTKCYLKSNHNSAPSLLNQILSSTNRNDARHLSFCTCTNKKSTGDMHMDSEAEIVKVSPSVMQALQDMGDENKDPVEPLLKATELTNMAHHHERKFWSKQAASLKELEQMLIEFHEKGESEETIRKIMKDYFHYYDGARHAKEDNTDDKSDERKTQEKLNEEVLNKIFGITETLDKKDWARASIHERDVTGRRSPASKFRSAE